MNMGDLSAVKTPLLLKLLMYDPHRIAEAWSCSVWHQAPLALLLSQACSQDSALWVIQKSRGFRVIFRVDLKPSKIKKANQQLGVYRNSMCLMTLLSFNEFHVKMQHSGLSSAFFISTHSTHQSKQRFFPHYFITLKKYLVEIALLIR